MSSLPRLVGITNYIALNGGDYVNTFEVQLVSLMFGLIAIGLHAFVQRSFLKWSLICLDILAFLIVGWLLATRIIQMR